MSDRTRPRIILAADGGDVSERLRERIIAVALEDNAGIASDRLTLEVEDAAESLAWPGAGAELAVALAAPGNPPVAQGTFTVDRVTAPLTGGALTVQAAAARFPATFKSPRSVGWQAITLGALVQTIAARHGFQPRVDPDLAAIAIQHLSQTDESDMNLLTRIARTHDAMMKPAGGRLLFLKRGAARTAAGALLPTIEIARAQIIDGRMEVAERDRYACVEARWRDLDAGETRAVTAGAGAPVLRLRTPYADEAAAAAAARARLARIRRGTARIDITLPGRPEICAEGHIRLAGFRDGVDALYTVQTVRHRFGRDAPFTTELTAELARERG